MPRRRLTEAERIERRARERLRSRRRRKVKQGQQYEAIIREARETAAVRLVELPLNVRQRSYQYQQAMPDVQFEDNASVTLFTQPNESNGLRRYMSAWENRARARSNRQISKATLSATAPPTWSLLLIQVATT